MNTFAFITGIMYLMIIFIDTLFCDNKVLQNKYFAALLLIIAVSFIIIPLSNGI